MQLYARVYGNDLLWQLGSKVYLAELLDHMDQIIAGNMTQKLHMNSGHDMTVAMMLHGIGYKITHVPDFSANIVFELHLGEIDNKHYVKTMYNDIPITFGKCTDEMCELETFRQNIVEKAIPGDIEDLCSDKDPLGFSQNIQILVS